MTTEQSEIYDRQRLCGFEYDWTDADGRIVLSRWNNTGEARWRTGQIIIDLDGGVSAYSDA
jgi:hypothetical protein